MDAFAAGELKIVESAPPPCLSLSWSGRGSDRDPAQTLGPYLRAAADRAANAGAAIELHCQGLGFVNAATIGCIIQLIHHCRASSVPVTVRYDKASRWQRLSFESMRMLLQGSPGFTVEAS